METPIERTRPLILLRQDVAPQKWHLSFAALAHQAASGVDGVTVGAQPIDKAGRMSHRWYDRETDPPTEYFAAPPGWAAYYDDGFGRAMLYFQNYDTK